MVKPPPLGSFPIERPVNPIEHPIDNSNPIQNLNPQGNQHENLIQPQNTTAIISQDDSRTRSRSKSVSKPELETDANLLTRQGAAEEEEDDDDQGTVDEDGGIIRCICGIDDDDGFTIQCDRCLVWQHCACFKMSSDNVPEEYVCEQCDPREVDAEFAKSIQTKRREEERSKEQVGPGGNQQDLSDLSGFMNSEASGQIISNELQTRETLTSKTSSTNINSKNRDGASVVTTKEEKTTSRRKMSQTLDLSNASFSSSSTQQVSSANPTSSGGRGGKRKQSQSRKQSGSELSISTTTSRLQTPREEKTDSFDHLNSANSNLNTPVSAIGNFNLDNPLGTSLSLNTNLTNNSIFLENMEKFQSWNVEFTPISKNIVVERKVLDRIKNALDLFKKESIGPLKATITSTSNSNGGSLQSKAIINSASTNLHRISVQIAPKTSRRNSSKFLGDFNEKDRMNDISFKPTVKGTEFGLSFISNECVPIEIKLSNQEGPLSSSSSPLSQFNSKTYIKQISEIASGSIFSNLNPNSTSAFNSAPSNLATTLNSSMTLPMNNFQQANPTSFSGISNGPSRSFSKPVMHGLFAENPISSGSFISEFKGELSSLETYKKDPMNQFSEFGIPKPHVHFLPKPFSMVIDGRRFGNESRFIRSSCHPNSVIRPILLRKNKSTGNGSSGFRTPINGSSLSREQSPMVFSKLGIENKDFLHYKFENEDLDQGSEQEVEEGLQEEQEEETELIFGVFALNDIQKTHEITLGWEWDDNHIVHFLPELMRNPANYISTSSSSSSSNPLKNTSNSLFPSKRNSANSTSRSRMSSSEFDLNQNPLPYLNTMFSYKMNQTLTSILGSCLCACIGSASPPAGVPGISSNNGSASSNNVKKHDCSIAQMLRVANGMGLLNVDLNKNFIAHKDGNGKGNKKSKLPDLKPLVGIKRGWDFNSTFSSSMTTSNYEIQTSKKPKRRNVELYDEVREEREIMEGRRIISSKYRNQLRDSLNSGEIQRVSEIDILKAVEEEDLKLMRRQREEDEREQDSFEDQSRSSDSGASSLTDPLSGLSDIEEDEDDEEDEKDQEDVDVKMAEVKVEEDDDDYDGPSVLPLKKRVSGTRIKASNNPDQEEEDHTPNFSNPSSSKGNSLFSKDGGILNLPGKRKRVKTKDSNDSLILSHQLTQQNKKASTLRGRKKTKEILLNQSDEDDDEELSSDGSEDAQDRSRMKKKARIQPPSSSSSAKRKRKDKSSSRPFEQSSPLSSLADADSESNSEEIARNGNDEDDSDELSEESRNSSLSPAPEEEDESGDEQDESGSDQDQKPSRFFDESSSPVRGPGRRKSLNKGSSSISKNKIKSSRRDDSSEEDEDQDESEEEEEASLPRSRREKDSMETPGQKKAKAKEKARRKALAELADPESSEEEEKQVKSKEQIKKSNLKEREKERERSKKREKENKARKKEKEMEKERKKMKKQRRVFSSEEDQDGNQSSTSSSSTEVRSRKRSKTDRDRTPIGRTPEPEGIEGRGSIQDQQPLQQQPQVMPEAAPAPIPAPEPPKPEPPRAKLSLADYKKRLAERKAPTPSSISTSASAGKDALQSPSEPLTPMSATSTSSTLNKLPDFSKTSSLPSFSKVSTTSTLSTPGLFASIGAPTALRSVEIPKSPPTPSRPLGSASAVSSTSIPTSTSIRQPWAPPSLPSRANSLSSASTSIPTSSSNVSAASRAPASVPTAPPSLSIRPTSSVPSASVSKTAGALPQPSPIAASPASESLSPTKPSDPSRSNRDRQSSNQAGWGTAHQRTSSFSTGSNNQTSTNLPPPQQPRARASSSATATVHQSSSMSINTSPTKDAPPSSPRTSNSIPSSPRFSESAAPVKSAPQGFRPLSASSGSKSLDSPFSASSAVSSLTASKFNPPRGPKALINSPAVPPTAPSGPSSGTATSSSANVNSSRPPVPTRPPIPTRDGRDESIASESSSGWRNVNPSSSSPDPTHSASHPIGHHRNSIDSPSTSMPRGPGSQRGGYGMNFRGRGASNVGSGHYERERQRDWERGERDRERGDVPPSSSPSKGSSSSSRGGGFPRGSGWGNRGRSSRGR